VQAPRIKINRQIRNVTTLFMESPIDEQILRQVDDRSTVIERIIKNKLSNAGAQIHVLLNQIKIKKDLSFNTQVLD
jgi:hypothetical protein